MTRLADKLRALKGPWGVALLVAVAFAAGALILGGGESERTAPMPEAPAAMEGANQETQLWTCAMHPQIKLPKPGKCPICGMDLVPLKTGQGKMEGMRELSVSPYAAKLMEIETVPVERKFVTAEIRMFGKVDYDETRVSDISAWVPGRLDRLFVDYTGVPVRKGDSMVYLYSPELLSAQEELLQAIAAVKKLKGSDVSIMREMSEATVIAAREKLGLLGLTPGQIANIEKSGKASDRITIYSPSGGIVIHKYAQEGMYVETGTKIYTIADLSQLWVQLDAYESDLIWLRCGQNVEFTTESYPGEVFKGSISFIEPILNEATRTVKVRVNAPNPEMKLKPGMFVRAVARAELASSGKVMDAALAGKWICPMHPEQVKNTAGNCSICGMPLVRTESLGHVGVGPEKGEKPLVIPASAPMITGKRAIVYVAVPDRKKPTYEGREIVLGPRAGDYYLVRRGLSEGERIVTKGNFKIDAELQIEAKPSMMTPEGNSVKNLSEAKQTAKPLDEHLSSFQAQIGISHEQEGLNTGKIDPEFRRELAKVVDAYLAVQKALATDQADQAVEEAKKAREAVGAVDMTLVSGQAHMDWMKQEGQLRTVLSHAVEAKDIEAFRKDFASLSELITATVKRFKAFSQPLYQFKCPMAFDNRGATWLQADEKTANPYFGKMMPECGDLMEVIPGEKQSGKHDHG